MSDPRNWIASDNNYYPTVAELLNTPNSDLTSFLPKAKMALLESLLHETLSQLKDAKEQKEQLITCWDENKRCLQQLQNSVTEIGKTSPKILSETSEPAVWADVVKKSLDQRDYDQAASETVVFYKVADYSDDIPITQQLEPFLKTLVISSSVVKCAKRLGERKTGQNKISSVTSRPRPIEVCLNSVFDKRLFMSNVSKWKSTAVFVKPKLCWKDRLIEKELLHARFEMVKKGADRSLFWIRDLKLFYNASHVDVSDIDKFMMTINTISDNLLPNSGPEWLVNPKICLLNARGLTTTTKRSRLLDYFITNQIELTLITETWWHHTFDDNVASLFGQYTVIRRRDRCNGPHGGIMALKRVSSSINFSKIPLDDCFDIACAFVLNG